LALSRKLYSDKDNASKTVNDLKLINVGSIVPVGEIPGRVITKYLRPPSSDKNNPQMLAGLLQCMLLCALPHEKKTIGECSKEEQMFMHDYVEDKLILSMRNSF
jgi:hypothetical protein